MPTDYYVMLDPQTRKPDTVFRAVHDRAGMRVELLRVDGWEPNFDVYENVVNGERGLRFVTIQGAKDAASELFGADAWSKKGGEQSGGQESGPTPGEGDTGGDRPTPA